MSPTHIQTIRMKTTLMGVLNITPDSFSDGGEYFNNSEKAVKHTEQMIAEGADYIDIGGESTRHSNPFYNNQDSETVDASEELRRVIPVITKIKQKLGKEVRISIDTWKANVAKEALAAGATAINSLGGFLFDEKLAEVVAKHGCMIIIYHIKGNSKTIQQGDITYTDVCREIGEFFEKQIAFGMQHGIKREQFVLDPGIGFGKKVEHNIEIIKNLSYFKRFNLPLLIGISRKSHIGILLKDQLNLKQIPIPTERLEGSLAETAIAVQNGASIIRTHDVKETKKFLAVLEQLI